MSKSKPEPRPSDRRGRTQKRAGTWRAWEPTSWAARHNTALADPARGYIYILGAPEASANLKIGKTTGDPKKRLTQIQTGSPVQLRVLNQYPTGHLANAELMMHAALAPWRTKGEWFNCDLSTARRAWRQVQSVWPDQHLSPQAWEQSHVALTQWAKNRAASQGIPKAAPPEGVHVPPFGPPFQSGKSLGKKTKKANRKYRGTTYGTMNMRTRSKPSEQPSLKGADTAVSRCDADLVRRVRRVALARGLRVDDWVSVRSVLDELVAASLPAAEKAEGLKP